MNTAYTVYHVMNRANAKVSIFNTVDDYRLFQEILKEAVSKYKIELLSFCIMPNHWHLILKPLQDGELSMFMAWLTVTHVRKWHFKHGTLGNGHLYKGRYKAIAIQNELYMQRVLRYVERNPLRANLVDKAENWPWSSLWIRLRSAKTNDSFLSLPLISSSLKDYLEYINMPQTTSELEEIRNVIKKSHPYGEIEWKLTTAKNLGLSFTLH